MKARTALLAAAALCATGLVSVAEAAPKAVCNVIKDDAGDAVYNGAVPGGDGDDITTADIASDGRTVTGVVRVKKLSAPNPQAPAGQAFFVEWIAKGSADQLFLSARTYPQGTQFVYGYRGVDPTSGLNTSYTLGTAKGVVDPAKNEVRISAPVADFVKATKAKMGKGAKLGTLTATTWRLAGQGFVPSQTVGGTRVPLGGFLLPFDDAAGTSYVVGTPSCVKVGK